MTNKEQQDIRKKLKVFKYAEEIKNVSKTCRYFGISRDTYYRWQKSYRLHGEKGLIDSKPCPENPKLRIPKEIEEKILYIRKNYHFGQLRISWYLTRYHGIKVSENGVRSVLLRHGLNQLPKNSQKRSPGPEFKRYEKRVPGHHVQIDVKFLKFNDNGKTVKRFQYTAIDDSTRIRALKVYERHSQANAIDFVDHVVSKFPFRIKTIRTDNGHEFQAKFHWHLLDSGITHKYIKKGTPRLNGKVERSHLTDKEEFYQLLEYTDDVDLHEKLNEWEAFYNLHRPHSAHKGKTPYENLMEKMGRM